MKRLTVILTAAAFTLVACGNNTGDADPAPTTTNSTSSKTVSSTSSSSTTTASETSSRETSTASPSSSASPQEPSHKVPQNSAPAQQPAQPVAPAEPVVVECLEGTPWPSVDVRWVDPVFRLVLSPKWWARIHQRRISVVCWPH